MQSYYRLKRYTRQHLRSFTYRDWRHPQTFTQNPKEKESCDFPERVAQRCTLDLDSEPPPMRSAACTSRLHVSLLNATNGASGTISARIMGEGKLLMLGVEGGWWMLRPAGVVLGPRADRLGTDRRLVPPEADGNRTQDDDAPT